MEAKEEVGQEAELDGDSPVSGFAQTTNSGAYPRVHGESPTAQALTFKQWLKLFFLSSLAYHLALIVLVSYPAYSQGHFRAPTADDVGRLFLMLLLLPFFSPHPYLGIALGSIASARRCIKNRLALTLITALLTVVGLIVHWLTALSPNFQRGINPLEVLQLLGAFSFPAAFMSFFFYRLSEPGDGNRIKRSPEKRDA